MQTFEQQKAFFEVRWPDIRAAMAKGGAEAAAAKIREHDDPMERRILFMFARQGVGAELDALGGLDAQIALADAGMAELLAQGEAAVDSEERNRRTDVANIISFNLAADLANCWPGDDTPREARHFERGLKAAKDCLRWREELNKPAGPRNMAWWARGMHEISLGRYAEAASSMAKALDYGKQAARDNGVSAEISAEGGFLPLLSAGYLGLARRLAGAAEGGALYEQAIGAFRAQLEDEGKKDDAQFGLDQLAVVAERYL